MSLLCLAFLAWFQVPRTSISQDQVVLAVIYHQTRSFSLNVSVILQTCPLERNTVLFINYCCCIHAAIITVQIYFFYIHIIIPLAFLHYYHTVCTTHKMKSLLAGNYCLQYLRICHASRMPGNIQGRTLLSHLAFRILHSSCKSVNTSPWQHNRREIHQ